MEVFAEHWINPKNYVEWGAHARGFFGVLASDASKEDGHIRFSCRDFTERRGFFFKRGANEYGHFSDSPSPPDDGAPCNASRKTGANFNWTTGSENSCRTWRHVLPNGLQTRAVGE